MATFFDLPPETRNSIYELLLTNSAPNLNVLTASRLVHEEAASYFYQNNAFTVDLYDVATADTTVLPLIPNKYLKYCRHLTIDIKLGYVSSAKARLQAQRLTALADHAANLTVLTLNFTSNASRIVSTTIDDCVLHARHPLTLALLRLLSSGVAKSVRVSLHGVWFAPDLATKLSREFEGSLEVVTSETSTDRAIRGQITLDHLRELGLDATDVGDLQHSDTDADFPSSLPSSLSSALSELDAFSPTDFLNEDPEEIRDPAEVEGSDSLFDEPMFDMDDVDEGSEEELTEDDDVEDEEMEDVNDLEAIIGSLEVVTYQRVIEKDVCYMTNFSPEMLGRWSEESA